MFLNFISDLSAADKVFFSIIIASILLVVLWYLLGKLINSLSAKKKMALQKEIDDRKAQNIENSEIPNSNVNIEESQNKEVSQTEETPDTVEETQAEETPDAVEVAQNKPALPTKRNTKKTIVAPSNDAIKPQVQTEEKKGRNYNGKYEIYQVAGGYAYHLKASNGEILVVSETFSTREGAVKAIDVVKKNLETGTIKFFSDKKGKFKFKLVSKNYRVLLISSNYPTDKGATRASESFKKFAVKADIVDIELVDAEAKTATVIQIQNKENKTGGKYHIEKYNGEYSCDLKASNGQILCQADGYTTKSGCLNSIESFKKSVQEGVFKCVKDKTGRYCFKLYSTTGRICLVGESYTSRSSAESAANSVAAFSQLAEIVEIK